LLALLAVVSDGYGRQGPGGPGIPGRDRPRIGGPLSLRDAVETSLKYNPAIQSMQDEADAAREDVRASGAMTRPQVSATTFVSSGSMPGIFSGAPGVMPANARTVPDRAIAADQNVMVMVPLYTAGRLGNLVKAASQRETAARAEVGVTEADAAYAVREAYYQALLGVEMTEAARARIDAAAELLEVTRNQFEAGKGIQASVARAAAELADAKRMHANADNARLKMLLELRRVMGVHLDSDIALSDTLPLVAVPPSAEDLEADLMEAARRRPELKAARARLDSASAETAAAKGNLKPQIYGAAMADAFTPRDPGMPRNFGGTVALTMSIPLFDSGRRRADAARMEAIERRGNAELADVELRVATEVRQARLDIATAVENHRAAEAIVASSQAAYDVVVLRVENQKSILVEQLDALAALTGARTNLAQASFDYAIAHARLDRAIGRTQ
jgi:outer membrane protein TolC